MLFLNVLSFACFGLFVRFSSGVAHDHPYPGKPSQCLDHDEALDISKRWLSIFSTGGVTSKAELATIVAQDLQSYDDTFGPPTTNINQLWTAISGSGKTTTTDVKQFPLFIINTCDQIAVNWEYTAVTTGYHS